MSIAISHVPRNNFPLLIGVSQGRPNLLTPQTAIDILSAAESTTFYYLVAACVYGTLEYVKSLHQAFKNTEDPLPKMLAFATRHNRPEIAKYCIDAGAGVSNYGPYDLHKRIVTGNSYETFKVLYHHGLDINNPIDHYGNILLCAVEEKQSWLGPLLPGESCQSNLGNRWFRTPYSGHCSYLCLHQDIWAAYCVGSDYKG